MHATNHNDIRNNSNRTVDFLNLKTINLLHKEEIAEAVERVTTSGWFIRGEATRTFETQYARFIGTDHCVGCGNGLDALTLLFMAYKEMGLMADGDEVIVPANTYIASILAVTRCRLKPVLVEPDIQTLQIDPQKIEDALTPRTRAVLIVHLYGKCAYTPEIGNICRKHNLQLVEDNAQAHGCCFGGKRTGSFGDGAHSFYPTKNLGALGDAGAITTDNAQLADMVRALGNYGSNRKYVFNHCGINSRLDEIQAAVLSVKLQYIDRENAQRMANARFYYDHISNPKIQLLPRTFLQNNVFHIFPVLCERRDELKLHLQDRGISTDVHYPIPPHQQLCYKQWASLSLPITERIHKNILSLPINQTLSQEDLTYVAEALNEF